MVGFLLSFIYPNLEKFAQYNDDNKNYYSEGVFSFNKTPQGASYKSNILKKLSMNMDAEGNIDTLFIATLPYIFTTACIKISFFM